MGDPVESAVEAIEKGGVIVYPTDTLWGLGASIEDERAVARVFRLKERPLTEPLSIALPNPRQVQNYAEVTEAAAKLMGLLPGPLTIILHKRRSVPGLVTGGLDHVGVRVPDHKDCLRLLARTGPLTSTSANLHGGAEPRTLDEARATFGNHVDFYLDSDSKPGGVASTIVDARSDSVKILRPGAMSESRIRQVLAG
ncbi:MAG: threonylcarbamoyl-AMP synthase [Euryarchaeota archaeon]|nr:threonylcarbamoyl-AMP synthase [Euryarchaeota archaeon]